MSETLIVARSIPNLINKSDSKIFLLTLSLQLQCYLSTIVLKF